MNPIASIASITRVTGVSFIAMALLAWAGPLSAQSLAGQVGYDRIYGLTVGVSGEVSSVSVSVGDRVKAGTLLLAMDDVALQPAVDAAAAEVAWKKALLEEAGRAWERDNELYAEGSLSQVELDLRNIARLDAEAGYRLSVAHHAAARQRLDLGRLVAPDAGVVLEVNTHPGDRINLEAESGPLLVLGSARLVVRALAAAAGTVLPGVGQGVEIIVADDSVSGSVTSVLPAADGDDVIISVATESLLPPPGSAVEVRY